MARILTLSVASGLALAVAACSSRESAAPGSAGGTLVAAPLQAPSLEAAEPAHLPGLPNVVAYGEGYWSGGVPEGDAGFDTLAALGVKTIISVDGAAPDVDAARARGIRYIHLPIGYDGFGETRRLELARASRDALADGPVYIHCHHGKHRSAGAAATVAVSLGWSSREAAEERMKVSGTSPSYQGLYRCAAAATPVADATLDLVPAEFPEVSRPRGMVAAMVEIEHGFDHLRAIEAAGWGVPGDHPDLVPAAEAGALADALRLMINHPDSAVYSADFAADMEAAWRCAAGVEELIVAGAEAGVISAELELLGATCKSCHAAHRD